jgi:uncharacterized membrane protein
MHYFPVAPVFMLLLLIGFVVVVALVEFGVLTYAYEKMGVGRRYILGILLLSLLGSSINIPVAQVPGKDVEVDHVVSYFGVWYVVPDIERREETTIAVNLGGAVIPAALSLYLLIKQRIYAEAALGVAVMTAVSHLVAKPVPGVGIAMPWLLPPVLAALTAVAISRRHAAPLAYISGSMGCLLGADILNLSRIAELGGPMASIGGAGVSDGIFLTGLIAVLLA